jgi:hypothetical protein
LAVQLKVRVTTGDRVVEAVATDLNEHGFFVQTSATIAADPPVQLEIALPDGPLPMEGRPRFLGHTIWGYGIGIEFSHASDEARTRWLRYVRSFSPGLVV